MQTRRQIVTGLGSGLALGLVLALAGCGALEPTRLGPTTVIEPVAVDEPAMLARLNAYRAGKGLPPVALDPVLTRVSADMARYIAERDSMKTRQHSAEGLSGRLDAAGYRNYAGAENLGAGYASQEAAFAGWQGSAGHDRNLLNPYVTRMGLARMRRSDGTWRHFWVMTLARPEADGRPTLVNR
ncbi:CAP domain-containing protein [Pannonibacter tanglangensis]|uniref:CAP domain-containing protein n=1 Tax=Pannonibacter tanglangensis TaxID=2750084 RepID=A0ABW9ZGZ2_9HYPH|nr:CAP domain-containing protein [Pannonibacter sp. XCT-34]NBN62429.1 CAP domain-containing protein [Pannonibacter sp. XCT-34]